MLLQITISAVQYKVTSTEVSPVRPVPFLLTQCCSDVGLASRWWKSYIGFAFLKSLTFWRKGFTVDFWKECYE